MAEHPFLAIIGAYNEVTSIQIYSSQLSDQLGTSLFQLTPGLINTPGPDGQPGSRQWDIAEDLSTAQAQDLLAGNWWVNVETQAYPSGELRGQITVVPEPTTIALFVLGGVALIARPWLSRSVRVQ